MLIILEGTDGAGKTTLADELESQLHFEGPVTRLHRGPLRDHPLREYELDLEDYRPDKRMQFICDRWHIGELLYGPVLRGKSQVDEPMRRHIDMFLAARGAFIVHVTTGCEETIRQRLRETGDDLVSIEQALQLRMSYNKFFIGGVRTQCGWTSYITDGNATGVRQAVVEHARRAEMLAAQTWSDQRLTRVGQPHPRLWLVGDKVADGPANRNRGHKAAFVPYPATSGHYLLGALSPVTWQCSAIINSTDLESAADLDNAPAIALGWNAHRRLDALQYPHAAVPHPQFVRRFHHRYKVAYAELIDSVAGTERNELGWRPS